MTPGMVLCDPDFTFADGTKRKKLFVLLSTGGSGSYICVKTTSKDRLYNVSQLCQVVDRYPNFWVPRHAGVFEKHTWIQLEEFYEFNSRWLNEKIVQGEIRQISHLGALTTQVLACARDAEDLQGQHRLMICEAIESLVEQEKPIPSPK